jgi:hypothetical protein
VPGTNARDELADAEEGEHGGSGDVVHERAVGKPVKRSSAGMISGPPESWMSRRLPAVNGMADRATSPAGTGQPRDGCRHRPLREVVVG